MRGVFSSGALRPLLKSTHIVSYSPVFCDIPLVFGKGNPPPVNLSKSVQFTLMAKSFCSQILKAGTENFNKPDPALDRSGIKDITGVGSPEHALASARGYAQYHSSAYFHHAGESRDYKNSPDMQKEHASSALHHQNKYHEYAARMGEFEKQGVKDTAKHHEDLRDFHKHALDIDRKYAGHYDASVPRTSMRSVHGELFKQMKGEEKHPHTEEFDFSQFGKDQNEGTNILEGFSKKEEPYANTLTASTKTPHAQYANTQAASVNNNKKTLETSFSTRPRQQEVTKSLEIISYLLAR